MPAYKLVQRTPNGPQVAETVPQDTVTALRMPKSGPGYAKEMDAFLRQRMVSKTTIDPNVLPAARAENPQGVARVVEENPKTVEPEPELKRVTFPCSKCSFEAASKAGLSAHVRHKHPG